MHEITPEQAAELFLVSKPGFSPLSESALIDAREMPFLTVKLEWYRGVNAFASIMGARAFVLFLRLRKILRRNTNAVNRSRNHHGMLA
ncbi:MAG: hypothetical protein K0Q85_1608 [Caproiciproducens sp.]|nr:hypothetical protein [Caproiciproducens sp.]